MFEILFLLQIVTSLCCVPCSFCGDAFGIDGLVQRKSSGVSGDVGWDREQHGSWRISRPSCGAGAASV